MMGAEVKIKPEVVVTTLRLPRDLITEVRIQAIRAGRTFNGHLVEVLKEAAGVQFGDHAPAARNDYQEAIGSEASSHEAR